MDHTLIAMFAGGMILGAFIMFLVFAFAANVFVGDTDVEEHLFEIRCLLTDKKYLELSDQNKQYVDDYRRIIESIQSTPKPIENKN